MIQDWHRQIRVKCDILDTQAFPRLQPEVVDILINDAIDLFIKQRYKEYEQTQKRSDELNPLVTGFNTIPTVKIKGIYTVPLPSDYFFFLNGTCVIQLPDGSTAQAFAKKTEIDDLSKVLDDPFKRSNDIDVVMTFQNNEIFLHHDAYPVVNFILTYFKKPAKVNFRTSSPSDFDDKSAEKEIINLVVTKILENFESSRIISQGKIPIE